MRPVSKSIKDLLYYLLSGAAARIFPLLLFPYIAHVLSPEDFGIFSLYRLYTALGAAIFLFGIEQGLFRLIPEYDDSLKERLNGSALYFSLFSGLIFGAVYILGGRLFQPLLFDANFSWSSIWLPLMITSAGFSGVILTYYSAIKNSRQYFVLSGLRVTLLFIVFTGGLVGGFGFKSFFAAVLVSEAAIYVLAWPLLKRSLRYRPRLSHIKELLGVGFPLMGVFLVTLLLYQSDHYLLKFFGNVETTGIYNYGYKFAAVLSLFVVLGNKVWLPRLYAQGRDFIFNNMKDYATLNVLAMQTLYLLLLTVFTVWKESLFPAGFEQAFTVIVIAGFGYIFYGHAQVLDGWLILERKSGILFLASLSALAVNLILNIVFIPRYGMLAAAVTTTLSFIVLWLSILIYLKRTQANYPFGRLVGEFLLGILPGIIFLATQNLFWSGLVLAAVALFLLRRNTLWKSLILNRAEQRG